MATEQGAGAGQGGDELKVMVESYRRAFESGDAAACASYFTEDATLRFLFGSYQGRSAIEGWHRDRFAADVKLLRIDGVAVDGDSVTAQVVVTSRRLRLVRMDQVKGTVTFRVEQGRFKEAVLSARKGAPSHLDWQFR
jgi:ketosteroid isomerase-like protein